MYKSLFVVACNGSWIWSWKEGKEGIQSEGRQTLKHVVSEVTIINCKYLMFDSVAKVRVSWLEDVIDCCTVIPLIR